MRPLRIVTVLPFFAWRFGGSVEVARLLCAELARRGHDVRVLTTDLGEPSTTPQGWSTCDGFRVLRVRAGWLHSRPPYLAPRALLTALDAELVDADVVTSQVGLTWLGARAAARCAAAGVPFVYAAQGALDAARLRHKAWRKALFLRFCERPLLRRASALHALCAREVADLRQQGAPANRIFVVPNAVDPDAWLRGDGASVRTQWGVPRDAIVVLFLGRLAPEKGVQLGLRAAIALLRQQPELWFVAAGPEGGSGREVRALAARAGVAERVLLPGPVPPNRRADVLAAADVFAYPSCGEGLPLAVLEAAAVGTALWITDRCNLPEVGEFGAGTVDPPEVDALRESLRTLVADEDARRRCAANAQRMLRARFALTGVVDRLEAVYANLT